MSAEVADVLRKAREKISDPARWTKGEFARDADGVPVSAGWGEDAVCWCAVGAIEAVVSHDNIKKCVSALSVAAGRRIEFFNDFEATTHADILAAFDRAIAAAESAQ